LQGSCYIAACAHSCNYFKLASEVVLPIHLVYMCSFGNGQILEGRDCCSERCKSSGVLGATKFSRRYCHLFHLWEVPPLVCCIVRPLVSSVGGTATCFLHGSYRDLFHPVEVLPLVSCMGGTATCLVHGRYRHVFPPWEMGQQLSDLSPYVSCLVGGSTTA
jgi:hypothetical protein